MNYLVCFIGGAVLATAVCIITFGPWWQPDKALVLRCRERVARFRELSEADQKVFLDSVRSNHVFYTQWKATCVLNNEFGGVKIELP